MGWAAGVPSRDLAAGEAPLTASWLPSHKLEPLKHSSRTIAFGLLCGHMSQEIGYNGIQVLNFVGFCPQTVQMSVSASISTLMRIMSRPHK
jgi:hypothetical protein